MVRNARVSAPPKGDDSQEEMTVIVVKVKGQGDTLRKGFEAISNAFASLGALPAAANRLAAVAPKQLNGAAANEDGDIQEDADESDPSEEATPTSSSPARSPLRKPKFLNDFDITTGDIGWKDFANARAPKNESEKYLLAALWTTEKANIPDFTISHIFTCFRAMKWNEQIDFSQPMRQMKLKDSYFSHPTRKTWKLTHPGLDAARAVKGTVTP
jgi:hypothetical protein